MKMVSQYRHQRRMAPATRRLFEIGKALFTKFAMFDIILYSTEALKGVGREEVDKQSVWGDREQFII